MWNPITSLLRGSKEDNSSTSITPQSPDSPSKERSNLPTAGTVGAPRSRPSDPVFVEDIPRQHRKHAESYRRVRKDVATAVIGILGENADEVDPELVAAMSEHQVPRPMPRQYADHAPRYLCTMMNVAEAVINILGERASDEIGPQLMVVCRGLIKHPPIGGNFKQAARRLLTVWAALQAVDHNRLNCLHLVDRCATLLVSIRDDVAQAGDELISSDLGLKLVVGDLDCAFMEIKYFLGKQSGRGFFKRCFQSGQTREARRCEDRLTVIRDLHCKWAQDHALARLIVRQRQLQADIALRGYTSTVSDRGSQPDTGRSGGLPSTSESADSRIDDERRALLVLLAALWYRYRPRPPQEVPAADGPGPQIVRPAREAPGTGPRA